MKRFWERKKDWFVDLAALLVFVPMGAYAAITLTTDTGPEPVGAGIYKQTVLWKGTSGTAALRSQVDGFVFQVVTVPLATQPTANYDITLSDSLGDIMGGSLANRSQTSMEQTQPLIAPSTYGYRFVDAPLTLAISNNLVSTRGKVVLYFQKTR